MAKKKATKKAAPKKAKKKYLVPGECGPLADLIFAKLKHKEGGETIQDLKADLSESVAFLEEIPDDAKFSDFDISDFTWSPEAEKIIKGS